MKGAIWRIVSTIIAATIAFAGAAVLAVGFSKCLDLSINWAFPDPLCSPEYIRAINYTAISCGQHVAGTIALVVGLIASAGFAGLTASFWWEDWASGRSQRERDYALVYRQREEAMAQVAELKKELDEIDAEEEAAESAAEQEPPRPGKRQIEMD